MKLTRPTQEQWARFPDQPLNAMSAILSLSTFVMRTCGKRRQRLGTTPPRHSHLQNALTLSTRTVLLFQLSTTAPTRSHLPIAPSPSPPPSAPSGMPLDLRDLTSKAIAFRPVLPSHMCGKRRDPQVPVYGSITTIRFATWRIPH